MPCLSSKSETAGDSRQPAEEVPARPWYAGPVPMNARSRFAFLALILMQGAHSIEEHTFRLYDVFAPARFVSNLVSDDPARGFAIANAAFVLFGAWCYAARVRPQHPSARAWAWPWVVVETGNGIGHLVLAATTGGYFPGAVTAPGLLLLAIYTAAEMLRRERIAGTTP